MTPALVDRWRAEAKLLRRRGADPQAAVLEGCADELEHELSAGDREELTLARAAMVSGYSVAHLRRLVADGELRNVAATGPTRVRRGDLPRKPWHPALQVV